MNLIACVNNNWAIGYDNDLLYHISEDMERFKQLTSNHVIVMGRKTLESLPHGKPLPNRINVILTRDTSYKNDDVAVFHSIDELDEYLTNYDTDEVFIIGGESIYKQLYNRCNLAYITHVFSEEENENKYFPNLNEDSNWELSRMSLMKYSHKYDRLYRFELYVNLTQEMI